LKNGKFSPGKKKNCGTFVLPTNFLQVLSTMSSLILMKIEAWFSLAKMLGTRTKSHTSSYGLAQDNKVE
jgi:hypothetical protein